MRNLFLDFKALRYLKAINALYNNGERDASGGVSIDDLYFEFPKVPSDKVMAMVEYLAAEGYLSVSTDPLSTDTGCVHLKYPGFEYRAFRRRAVMTWLFGFVSGLLAEAIIRLLLG